MMLFLKCKVCVCVYSGVLNTFYEILIDVFPEFPVIDDQDNTKRALLEHLNKNFLKYQEYYFDALNYI